MRYIVTSGKKDIDIDAYASVLAHVELLKLEGKDALAVFEEDINGTLTDDLRKFKTNYKVGYESNDEDVFIVHDVSEPEYIATFVIPEKVVAIYDHHWGYKDYWLNLQTPDVRIEKIGANSTLVVEQLAISQNIIKISEELLVLLAYSILENTLNLKAGVTTERDILALKLIENNISILINPTLYFLSLEKELVSDILSSIIGDTKITSIFNKSMVLSQIALWDISEYESEILKVYENYVSHFNKRISMITIPSISNGDTTIIVNKEYKERFKDFFEEGQIIEEGENYFRVNQLYLRKELLKRFQQLNEL